MVHGIIMLCSAITFICRFSRTGDQFRCASTYLSGQGRNNGTYKIYSDYENTYLNLSFANGKSNQYKLATNEKRNTFLYGSRYYVINVGYCFFARHHTCERA